MGARAVATLVWRVLCLASVGVIPAAPAHAGYPDHPVKIIVPVGAGSAADSIPRLVAEKLAETWHMAVVIENRPGGANNIGAEAVAHAAPDGYTLLAAPSTALVVNESLYPHLPFDPHAFVPITILAEVPNVLVTTAKLSASTVHELIQLAKRAPGKLNYASSGVGTSPQLAMELMNISAGIQVTHVAYKSLPAALIAVLSGEADMMFDNVTTSLPHVRQGQLHALAVGSAARLPELPGVPAMSEIFPGFSSVAWFAMVAPPKTPPAIATTLSRTVGDILRRPDVARRIGEFSAHPMGGSPAETAAFFAAERARWRQVITTAGIKLQ